MRHFRHLFLVATATAALCGAPAQPPTRSPGFTDREINTSATDFRAVGGLRLQRFDGQRWAPVGEVVDR